MVGTAWRATAGLCHTFLMSNYFDHLFHLGISLLRINELRRLRRPISQRQRDSVRNGRRIVAVADTVTYDCDYSHPATTTRPTQSVHKQFPRGVRSARSPLSTVRSPGVTRRRQQLHIYHVVQNNRGSKPSLLVTPTGLNLFLFQATKPCTTTGIFIQVGPWGT